MKIFPSEINVLSTCEQHSLAYLLTWQNKPTLFRLCKIIYALRACDNKYIIYICHEENTESAYHEASYVKKKKRKTKAKVGGKESENAYITAYS